MGRGCPRNKMGRGSLKCCVNWSNKSVGQLKNGLMGGVTQGTGMASTSAHRPRRSPTNKVE